MTEKRLVLGPSGQLTDNIRLTEAIESGDYEEVEVFKDDRQTYSALICLDGHSYVLKIPRDRNNRRWQRVLSMFRVSEAVRHYRSMLKLPELGLSGPEPVVAIEKRRWGMVVHSLLLYRFRQGRKATREDARLVLPHLLALHDSGYLRNDPHAKNYLIDNGDVIFIDFRLTRPVFLRRFRLQRELALFLKTSPLAWDYLPEAAKNSWSLRLAVAYEEALRVIRYGRRRIRGRSRLHF